MLVTLLSHQWKEFWRARNANKNLAIQILMAFIFLYFLLVAVAVGIVMPHLLEEAFPDEDIIVAFCGMGLYYFSFDIIIRFVLQELPTLTIQPYLTQNIQRRQLVNFLNLRSLLSLFNLLPFVILLPFVFSTIRLQYGGLVSLCFAVAIVSLCIFNHFAILYIKRKTIISSWWLAGVTALVLLLIGADYLRIFSIRKVSEILFTGLLLHPWLCAALLALAVDSFLNNRNFLLKNLYVEELVKSSGPKASVDYVWLNKFGDIGELMAMELKLILRNKRPRNTILTSGILLFYGFLLYKPSYILNEQWGFVLMGAILITGCFLVSYGQLLFAWQSGHFDGLMTLNLDLKTYIKSKLMLLTAFSTVAFLLSLLYGFMNVKIIPIEIAAYFFNIGINAVICVYFATRHYKAIDIGKGTAFNYQGASASRYWYSLALSLIALCIYWPFALLINNWAGIIALGVLGLISFLLRDVWVNMLVKELGTHKHEILEGFRDK